MTLALGPLARDPEGGVQPAPVLQGSRARARQAPVRGGARYKLKPGA